MAIYDEINSVLEILPTVHKNVLADYLQLRYNISPGIAESSIHKAALAHACFEQEHGFISHDAKVTITSRDIIRSRAFRIALEFMAPGEIDFVPRHILDGRTVGCAMYVMLSPTPQQLQENPAAQARLVEICSFSQGNEMAFSYMLAQKPISAADKQVIYRIGIVDPSFRVQYVKKVGFMMFIPFANGSYDFKKEDIINMDEASRWDDVQ